MSHKYVIVTHFNRRNPQTNAFSSPNRTQLITALHHRVQYVSNTDNNEFKLNDYSKCMTSLSKIIDTHDCPADLSTYLMKNVPMTLFAALSTETFKFFDSQLCTS